MRPTIMLRFSLLALGALTGFAQSTPGPDTSANAQLKGTYYFRQLITSTFDSSGNVTGVASLSGTMVFDGKGGYTATGQKTDSKVSSGASQPLSAQGTYGVGSNGLAYLDNPYTPTTTANQVYGSLAQGGVLIGSSTEGLIDDIFIAIPAPTTAPSVLQP